MTSSTFSTFKLQSATGPGTFNGNMYTSFDTGSRKSASRAQAQAQYRERNLDAEREKARARMRARREEEKAQARRVSSACLRTSALFARYKRHVGRHSIAVYGDENDPEYVKGFQHLNLKSWAGDADNEIELEDAIFMLQHAAPERRTSKPDQNEIERFESVSFIHQFIVGFDWDEAKPCRPLWYIHPGGDNYNDDDLEFMFRHCVPAPTIGSMDDCGCT
ncbi:hypothetical protein C8R47DRAFT_1212040 [Mycena vitilis]|nr:hypothetical protein C8R47DRAFT_1212040 [Mycena vitilis]